MAVINSSLFTAAESINSELTKLLVEYIEDKRAHEIQNLKDPDKKRLVEIVGEELVSLIGDPP